MIDKKQEETKRIENFVDDYIRNDRKSFGYKAVESLADLIEQQVGGIKNECHI